MDFSAPLFPFSGRWITLGEAMVAGGACLLVLLFMIVLRQSGARRRAERAAHHHARELEARIDALLTTQAEMTGRMKTMSEHLGQRQSDLMRSLNERLDGFGHKLGQSMAQSSQTTQASLSHLHERLGIIDRAQKTITDLSGQVDALQQILSNKQARGAFGQGRMEAIIQDALPDTGYAFQATLSTGSRPDCLIFMPNGAAPLVIDAKFPLEAFNRIRDEDDDPKAAAQQFRRDVAKHVLDIRERYLLAGETQDTAFMFVPSESLFAELHENFSDIVQKANRARVVIVSPSLLMLSIQVIQSILRDQRMREQAHVIQAEVRHLMEDVTRLDERVAKLQQRHGQTGEAIGQILTTTGKITRRGERIDALDLDEEDEARRDVAKVARDVAQDDVEGDGDVLPIQLRRSEPGGT
ncbi:DNA recombination protein RmuC [Breoghania corrubedonensis]|uniref:DNA recombination protein RmuC homolog n=1 Tax=Breoghania corrubedonensis TaxID=665038 RepID=A0A2T5VG10_9HYPH|nr:DNA recombination protein RmuC [Breoghania corrubedonensis]PTW62687.1 DNA recombination protein RmuC [Breoghania corrubedonensis]